MAINANTALPYNLRNYRQHLASVIARAEAGLSKGKLRDDVQNAVRDRNFVGKFQIDKPDSGRLMTIGELCDSALTDTVAQVVDPKAVERVLFGQQGLIHKAGGGRYPYLMEDIEVGFIYDPIDGTSIGPSITSGRHRLFALQILLSAAGLSDVAIDQVAVRVGVVKVRTAAELQARIIAANVGSREFSRSEVRERTGSTEGVSLLNTDTIAETISFATNEATFKAAIGAWLKDAANKRSLNGLTHAQYSDAGTSVWNKLGKQIRPNGGTLYAWVRNDTTRFLRLVQLMENNLDRAVEQAANDPKAGSKSGKLADHLVTAIKPAIALDTVAA